MSNVDDRRWETGREFTASMSLKRLTSERDYWRNLSKSWGDEMDRLRHGLGLIVQESEQFPDDDGIGAGTMARNLLASPRQRASSEEEGV